MISLQSIGRISVAGGGRLGFPFAFDTSSKTSKLMFSSLRQLSVLEKQPINCKHTPARGALFVNTCKRAFAVARPPPPPPLKNESEEKEKGSVPPTRSSSINSNSNEDPSRKASIDSILGLNTDVKYAVSSDDSKKDTAKLGGFQRIRLLWKQYGTTAIFTYFCLYWSTLGSVYLLIDQEVISATILGFESNDACIAMGMQSFNDLIVSLTGSGLSDTLKSDPAFGKLLMSLVMTEFTEPLRIGATLFIVPKIAKNQNKTTDS